MAFIKFVNVITVFGHNNIVDRFADVEGFSKNGFDLSLDFVAGDGDADLFRN